MTIIKLISFLISFVGLCLFFNNKLKIQIEFSPILAISSIVSILFATSLITKINYISIGLCIVGIVLFILNFKQLKNRRNLIIILTFILITMILYIRTRNECLDDAGNFEFWGLRLKNLLVQNRLPIQGDPIRLNINYPFGAAYWDYYFCYFVGRSDGVMMMSQTMISIASLFTFVAYIKKNNLIRELISFGFLSVFLLTVNVGIYTLTVETTMPLLALAAINCIKGLKKSYLSLFILILLALTKNYSILFVIFSVLVCFSTEKQYLHQTLIQLIVPIIALLVWDLYTLTNYGFTFILGRVGVIAPLVGLILSVLLIVLCKKKNIVLFNKTKSITLLAVIVIICIAYIVFYKINFINYKHVISLFISNIMNIQLSLAYGVVFLTVLLIITILLNIKNKLLTLLKVETLIIIYFVFSLFLIYAYCTAFPNYEISNSLASIGRYMKSLTILFVGITAIDYFESDAKVLNTILLIILVIATLINPDLKSLFRSSTEEERKEVYWFAKDNNFEPYKDYILINPPSFKNGLFKLCVDYDLLARNMNIVEDNIAAELQFWQDNYDYLIIWTHSDETDFYLDSIGYDIMTGKDKAVIKNEKR